MCTVTMTQPNNYTCNTHFPEWISWWPKGVKSMVLWENHLPWYGAWIPMTWHSFYETCIFGEHHNVARRLPRRGECCSLSPWSFKVSSVFKASNLNIRAFSSFSNPLNETIALFWWFLCILGVLDLWSLGFHFGKKKVCLLVGKVYLL